MNISPIVASDFNLKCQTFKGKNKNYNICQESNCHREGRLDRQERESNLAFAAAMAALAISVAAISAQKCEKIADQELEPVQLQSNCKDASVKNEQTSSAYSVSDEFSEED